MILSLPTTAAVLVNLSAKYDQIERDLIDDFKIAHHGGEKKKMKRIAAVLSHFKVNILIAFLSLLFCLIHVQFDTHVANFVLTCRGTISALMRS